MNKNIGLETSRFWVTTHWRGGQGDMGWSQFLFTIREISCQKVLCQIVANVGVKSFHIVTHSFVASFSIKPSFCAIKNIFQR